MHRRIYWGVVTPDESDGVPALLFASEEWCRLSADATRKEDPRLGEQIRVVRVRLTIDSIEQGES